MLGVMNNGIRLVQCGLYNPGEEIEIDFFKFQDITKFDYASGVCLSPRPR